MNTVLNNRFRSFQGFLGPPDVPITRWQTGHSIHTQHFLLAGMSTSASVVYIGGRWRGEKEKTFLEAPDFFHLNYGRTRTLLTFSFFSPFPIHLRLIGYAPDAIKKANSNKTLSAFFFLHATNDGVREEKTSSRRDCHEHTYARLAQEWLTGYTK